jgi:Cft2 family RNA processing exonuclease
LIPVFALGKLQEMLSTLWNLMEHGILSKVELYTGGIGQKINTVYDKNRYVVRRVDPELELNAIPQRDLYDIERIEDLTKTPGIVLASSGMVIEGTLSFRAAEHWLKQHESAIFVVGYMDPETPGYRIANSSRGSLIQLTDVQEPRNVSCSIERFRFTAHSPREGLIHIVKCLQPRHVILIHGDEAAIDWMGHTILKTYPSVRVSAAENGKLIELQ